MEIKANFQGKAGEKLKFWMNFAKEEENQDTNLYRIKQAWECERNRLTNLINHARYCLNNLTTSDPKEKSPFPELIPQWEAKLKLINKLGIENFLNHYEFQNLIQEWKINYTSTRTHT